MLLKVRYLMHIYYCHFSQPFDSFAQRLWHYLEILWHSFYGGFGLLVLSVYVNSLLF